MKMDTATTQIDEKLERLESEAEQQQMLMMEELDKYQNHMEGVIK